MLRFKSSNMEMEFNAIHPVLRDLITRLDRYCLEEDLPTPVITECLRTPEQQEAIYYKQMMRQFSLNEDAARARARIKDTMHFYGCAVDLRDSVWTPKQKQLVVNWLRAEMAKISNKPGFWEFLPMPHGTGSHIHLARKDEIWIRNYRAKHDSPLKIVVGLSKNNEEPTA